MRSLFGLVGTGGVHKKAMGYGLSVRLSGRDEFLAVNLLALH